MKRKGKIAALLLALVIGASMFAGCAAEISEDYPEYADRKSVV